uniref:Uncharacterized protein n=1 Tax=Timema bartmani TaxID=61472 RepID=A0A7R9HWJ3_9NEOP|nr:unnamed protein product [Timema bartmani]
MGTKRSHDGSKVSDPETPEKKSGHWAFGLLTSMKDSKSLVEEDTKIVVIKDKYPKVKLAQIQMMGLSWCHHPRTLLLSAADSNKVVYFTRAKHPFLTMSLCDEKLPNP